MAQTTFGGVRIACENWEIHIKYIYIDILYKSIFIYIKWSLQAETMPRPHVNPMFIPNVNWARERTFDWWMIVDSLADLLPSGSHELTASCSPLSQQLARLYDMLIIEDDPYYFLQFDKVQPTLTHTDSQWRSHESYDIYVFIYSGICPLPSTPNQYSEHWK